MKLDLNRKGERRMQTKREAMLAIYRGEMPEFIPAERLTMDGVVFPGDRDFGPEKVGTDMWGVSWTKLGPDPGLDGSVVTPGTELFDDIEEWKKYVKFPEVEKLPLQDIFDGMLKASGVNREEQVVSCLMLSGQFERLNEMMGMENALCAFYESPEAVHEYMEAMCEYKLKCIDLAYQYVKPDVIHMQDDWGSSQNMLFSPEIWREFIKPNEKRYADRIHELGMLYEHHSCGYITQIIPDLVEIGVDVINPLNVCNDMEMIKREYGDKITLKGGIDNQLLDQGECNEEQIRRETRRAMDAYAAGGRYIPAFVYTRQDVLDIFNDEVTKYGAVIYKK